MVVEQVDGDPAAASDQPVVEAADERFVIGAIGAIIGVGATKRLSAVRWGVTVNLLWAWVLTIPVSAVLASIVYLVVSLFVK